MEKTILRVAEEIELTNTLLDSLKGILGSDFVIKRYSTNASSASNLESSYSERIKSLSQSFQFIAKAVPSQAKKEELNAYLSWCLNACNIESGKTLHDYEDVLARFTAFLIDGLLDYWKEFASLDEAEAKKLAIEMLNRAEQYIIMQEGRPNLATLSMETTFGESKCILQWDKSLPPYTEETLNELQAIKENSLGVTPEWFRELSPISQIYIHASEVQPSTINALKSNLTILEAAWKYVKANMEPAPLLKDLESIAEDKIPVPSWFSQLSNGQQRVFRELASRAVKEGIDCIDSQFTEIRDSLVRVDLINYKDVCNLPYWFLRLPAYEQLFLKKILSESEKVEDVVSYLPSRLRSLPLLANFGEHELLFLYPNGKVKKLGKPRLRSSHLSSRDLEREPANLGQEHSNRNVKQICKYLGESQALFIQTLISPIALPSQLLPDPLLDKHRRHATERLRRELNDIEIYTSNHPLNVAKYVLQTGSYNKECLAILNRAREELLIHNINKQVDQLGIDSQFTNHILSLLALAYAYPKAFNSIRQFINKPKMAEEVGSFAYDDFIKQVFSENAIPEIFNSDLWVEQELDSNKVKQSLDYITTLKSTKPLAFNLATRLTDLAQLYAEYYNVLNSGYGTATIFDYRGRELWLSSLENLIMMYTNGLSYGSCVSGKDRKALELIHTDAMLIYHEIYGAWPSFFDGKEARENFERIVSDLYVTRHAHVHAARGADGAAGIKTPSNYLPKDITEGIKKKAGKQALEIDDRLATNNEVRRIVGLTTHLKPGYARCVVAAMRLSEQNQEQILEKIKLLIGEKSYWQKQLSYRIFVNASPKGIAKIQQVFDEVAVLEELPAGIKTRMLADIYHTVLNRPKDSELRNGGTKALYSIILNLYNSTGSNTEAKDALQKLQEIKAKSFEDNIKDITHTLTY
ncbi:oxidoreductase [Legionella beliardensis]|uniref:Oxidoreductase n=1 Tax=Legionella beliardensis TaxID=91822 RepID=A0A378HXK6_9GAMM|nr:Dot/Icm T4SS effector PI-3-phosphatase SidP [Legionella beliardensis]STX27658.1 oxidoreductase [Legionella beliardensis]